TLNSETAGVRFLIISSHCMPLRGGAAVVYDQICRNADGRGMILSVKEDYDTGLPIAGVKEFDAAAPYRVVRVGALRPATNTVARGRVGAALSRIADLRIYDRTLIATLWCILRYRIEVVCVGDVISLGWLAFPVHRLLRRK